MFRRIAGIPFLLSIVFVFLLEYNGGTLRLGEPMAAVDMTHRFETVSINEIHGPNNSNDRFTNFLNMEFVFIPPGSFRMGSPNGEPGRDPDEHQHRVILRDGFYVQSTEVTNRQFAIFLNRVEWKSPENEPWLKSKNQDEDSRLICANGQYRVEPGYENHPVVEVTWYGAAAFTDWLFEKTGELYRLPTEAEWEYLCRAGTTTRFSVGDWADCSDMMFKNKTGGEEKADYCIRYILQHGSSINSPAPVASYPANPWGIFDVHGNVWEWCRDWYGPYPEGGLTDTAGPASGENRVVRGGSWEDGAKQCRSGNRNAFPPGASRRNLGFRVVKSR